MGKLELKIEKIALLDSLSKALISYHTIKNSLKIGEQRR